jgi:hypothetical protein
MPLKIEKLSVQPPALRRGPRNSPCFEVVSMARENDGLPVAVTSGDRAEVERFYKAMIQWRGRHRADATGEAVRVTKTVDESGGPVVYVWIEPVVSNGESKPGSNGR